MKKIKNILMIAVLCLTLLGCGKKELQELTVTYVTAPLNIPSIVEKEIGMLEEKTACKVKYAQLTTGAEQTQALASGDVQILNAVGSSAVFSAVSNGADIKIIDIYGRSPGAFKLFAEGEEIKNVKDLKGKKIAGPKGSTLYEMLVRYLEKEGMSIDEIEFINLEIPKARAALESGTVDAALLAGPNAYHAEKSVYPVITTGEGLVDGLVVTATTNEFAQAHPEIIKEFKEMQKKVLTYIEDKPDETIECVCDATQLSAEAVEEMMPLYDFSSEITKKDVESLKSTSEFMMQHDMMNKKVEIEELILE